MCRRVYQVDSEDLIPRGFRQKGTGLGTARLTLSTDEGAEGA